LNKIIHVNFKNVLKQHEQLSQGWGQIATPLQDSNTGAHQKLNCVNALGLFFNQGI